MNCACSRPGWPTDGRSYTSYEELVADYRSGALHPGDLKPALAKHINQILQVHWGQLLGGE